MRVRPVAQRLSTHVDDGTVRPTLFSPSRSGRTPTGSESSCWTRVSTCASFPFTCAFARAKSRRRSYTRKVQSALPPSGNVQIIYFTDKQYENIVSFNGREAEPRQQKSGTVHAVLTSPTLLFLRFPACPASLGSSKAGQAVYFSRWEIGGQPQLLVCPALHDRSCQILADGRSGANRNSKLERLLFKATTF